MPYRAVGGRDRTFGFVLRWWQRSGLEVFVADAPGEWNLAAARNAAAVMAGEWDAAVFTDADTVLGSYAQLEEAVRLAGRFERYVAPHDIIHYMIEPGVTAAINGLPLDLCCRDERSVRDTWESPVVMPRKVWDATGGFDERFRVYGYGNEPMMLCAQAVTELRRLPGPTFHLDHERPAGRDEWLRVHANLIGRYRDAAGDPDRVLAVARERFL